MLDSNAIACAHVLATLNTVSGAASTVTEASVINYVLVSAGFGWSC